MNQLLIQILLMMITTAIVVFTCMNLVELVDMFSDAAGNAMTQFNFGFWKTMQQGIWNRMNSRKWLYGGSIVTSNHSLSSTISDIHILTFYYN